MALEAADGEVSIELLPELADEAAVLDLEPGIAASLDLAEDERAPVDVVSPDGFVDAALQSDVGVVAGLADSDMAGGLARTDEIELIAAADDRPAAAEAAEPGVDAASTPCAVTSSDTTEGWSDDLAEDQAGIEIPDDLETTLLSAASLTGATTGDPAKEAPAESGTEMASDPSPETVPDTAGDWSGNLARDQAAVDEGPLVLETALLSAAGLAAGALPASEDDAAAETRDRAGSGEDTTADAATATEIPAEAPEDEVDLFATGDEAVIDMEMLRELIVQVLREELQGPLGERITRNVRKLVRQEIARALEAQKFE